MKRKCEKSTCKDSCQEMEGNGLMISNGIMVIWYTSDLPTFKRNRMLAINIFG